MKEVSRLFRYVLRYWPRVLLALILMFMGTALTMLQPKIIQWTFDSVYEEGKWHLLVWMALATIGATVLQGIVNYVERITMEWVGQRTIYDLRNRIYNHLQSLSFSFYDTAQTGELMSRATADVEQLRRFVTFGVMRLVGNFVTFVFVLFTLLAMDWKLTLLSLGTMPLLGWAVAAFNTRVRPRYRLIQEEMAKLTTTLQENISGVRVVRAYAQEEREIEKFRERNWSYLEENITTVRLWAFYFPLMTFITGFGTTLILWYGGRQVILGALTLGQMIAFNSLLGRLIRPVRMLGWLVNMYSQASAAAQRVFEILDTQPEVKDKPGAIELPPIQGNVHFDNVSFAYDGVNLVLHDINIEAKQGQRIAILGGTGSGKSTLINLLPRFYDVTKGAVKIDGIDVRDVTLESLRRQIGIVLQETFLFSATIRENIAYGRLNASNEEVIAAAKAARIHDFIISLPNGYDTVVGERGVGLSGGQKQRIAIARALLLDPRILILDDSLSAVDTETEYLIQQALEELMKNRTSFVIAQRLSTVKNADQIIILDNGRIVERGTHETLLAAGGIYKEIYDLQFRKQEETNGLLEQVSTEGGDS
ncbi:MAG: ABC transporter ATP-binding protein [Firmicutes bacterium]|nr:ABC transporter ATP-binding protein [Bacillota bacterium]